MSRERNRKPKTQQHRIWKPLEPLKVSLLLTDETITVPTIESEVGVSLLYRHIIIIGKYPVKVVWFCNNS